MTMNEKKPVIITSLAMRFPISLGWTLDILNSYLIEGSFEKKTGWPELGMSDYYILNVGSILDTDKLYKDGHVGPLCGRANYDELKYLSDLEVLKSRNW
jgi:hypothetical protein